MCKMLNISLNKKVLQHVHIKRKIDSMPSRSIGIVQKWSVDVKGIMNKFEDFINILNVFVNFQNLFNNTKFNGLPFFAHG